MNKRTFEIADALGEMDDAMVSEAARAAVRPRRSRIPFMISAAAALVLIVGTALVLPRLLKSNKDKNAVDVSVPAPDLSTSEPAVNVTDSPDGNPAASVSVYGTAAPAETPSVIPMTYDRMNFNTVSAVALAASSGRFSNENEALHNLTEIFMPTKVPYGAKLADIEIAQDIVTVTYNISEEWIHDESDPNRFVLIWHRNWLAGSAEETARRRAGRMMGYDPVLKSGVWIVKSLSGIENCAVWEKDGNGFELIVPGYYSENSDILSFTGLVRVDLTDVGAHSPSEGFSTEGYMWLSENSMGYSPIVFFAFGTTYYKPDDGGEGRMLPAEGADFLSSFNEMAGDHERLMNTFPRVGYNFEPVLLDGCYIYSINVYSVKTLEPLASDIRLEELRDIARLDVSGGLAELIAGEGSGCVLVDIIVVHRNNYIPALDEYEEEAYHCGFILECGN